MDELQLVREYFGEQPPPEPDVAAAAKARLALGERGSRAPRPGRHSRRALLLGAGLPVAAAAVQAPSPVPAPAHAGPVPAPAHAGPVPAPAHAGSSDGREILLMAARTVARAAQHAPARYWVTSGTVGNFRRVGPADDPYLVLEEVGIQYWAARSPHDPSPSLSQALRVSPASPADQAAWRRDGSPTVWKDVGQDTSLAYPDGETSGKMTPLSAVPGKLTAMSAAYGAPPFVVGDEARSLRQLLALPADPVKLKQLLLTGWSHYMPGGSQSSYLLQAVPPVLQMPVTPAVRSGLYRMLATMPGMRSLGVIKDVTGKQGVAVAYTGTYANCGQGTGANGSLPRSQFTSCRVQQILVIDPATGLPQAEELRYVQLPRGQKWSAPDGLFSYEIFGESYWTNHDRPGPRS